MYVNFKTVKQDEEMDTNTSFEVLRGFGEGKKSSKEEVEVYNLWRNKFI